MNEFFLIAKVVSISAKDGYLKLKLFTDHPEQLYNLKSVYFDFWGSKKKLLIEDVVRRGENYFIKLKNFSAERELMIFTDREIFLHKSDLISLPENAYYIHDLIGCKVFCGDKLIGEVKNVLTTPANDVLEIFDQKNNLKLLPFVLKFYDEINPERKVIFVKEDSGICDDED